MSQLTSASAHDAFLASIRPGSQVGYRLAGWVHRVIILREIAYDRYSRSRQYFVFDGPDLVELVKDLDVTDSVHTFNVNASSLEPLPDVEYPETREQLERQMKWADDWLTRCDTAW
jgi:hypothetical protein